MELEGVVTSIIFRNQVNSYTIAQLEMPGEETTIVGYMPFVVEGDTLKVIGKYVEHREYGVQFKVETFEKQMPQTLDALERYLANGMIKGVGKATAKKIVKNFQEETINVIKYDPLKLTSIRGINEEKAIQISKSFIENFEVWQIVRFLEKFNIGVEHSKKIYDVLGIDAIVKIQENPYVLIDLARGVDFFQIDKMAMDLGIEMVNDKRVQAGIKYALIQISYNGHCCTLKEHLVDFVKDLLRIENENVENNIINLKVKGEIVVEEREDEEQWIYLNSFYNAEIEVKDKILKLKHAKNVKKIKNIDIELTKIERMNDLILSEKQKQAVKLANENNVTIVTGGPGTGKTTIIKTIIGIYKKNGKKVVLTAPTGRAAKRMTETTGEEASTLHRLLEIGKIDDDLGLNNREYVGTPIDADVIIVDEVSMVDLFLMNCLLKSIYLGSKLILVGDIDQLASVGPGSILKDFIESEKIPTVHLDKIFRQAAKSKIILNAHRVNSGKNFIKKEEQDEEVKDDFFLINEQLQEKILAQIISLSTGRLKKYGNYDFFENIQVLTPTKKGLLGTKELNMYLQRALNPENISRTERVSGSTVFREGDRVMQVKNNYDIEWEKNKIPKEIGTGVFNGEIGYITKIDNLKRAIQVTFDDDKCAWYEFNELEQLEHSYAITIHKSQGSEFDVVIMVLPKASPMLLTRNLLYTGITRAKELLIVIGSQKTVDFMIQNVDIKMRNTGLKYKLMKEK